MLKTLMPSLPQLITADYKSVKTKESEKIIASMLAGLQPVAKPELRQISGIPGAGKSTYCQTHLPANFLFLSFDKIMVALSGYQQTLAKEGAVAAYQQYEMPARIIGYEVLRRALRKHYNILFEHSGTNNAHVEMFKNLPKKGYQTSVNFIVCDTNTAIARTKERAKKINRFISEDVIKERASGFAKYASIYQKITPKIRYLDGENNFRSLNKI